MEIVKKRILTLKSKLGFGKYETMMIDDIIRLNKSDYLRWVYFNYSAIDFIPEILDTIQIPIEYRLSKPAINPEFLPIVDSKAIEIHKFIEQDNEESKEKRKKVLNTFKVKKQGFSKIDLLRKNHGH